MPIAPWFDVQVRVIPNHPDLPDHLHKLQPEIPNSVRRVLRRQQRASKRDKQTRAFAAPLPPLPVPDFETHTSFYPDYPEDWIDVTEDSSEDYLLPTLVAIVPSRTIGLVYRLAKRKAWSTASPSEQNSPTPLWNKMETTQ